MNIRGLFPKKELPWEGLDGFVYSAQELRPRKPWVERACFLLCLFLIAGGLVTRYRIALLFGVLYILVLLMDKRMVVTERGVEIFYQMRIATHYEFWPWEEIDALARENRNHPELVALYFNRGDRVKRLFFRKADAQAIMDYARAERRGIRVSESDEKRARVPRYYGSGEAKKKRGGR